MTVVNISLKALGALLTYPDPTLVSAVPELRQVLENDPEIPSVLKPRLRSLFDYLVSTDPFELEEAYVAQFDTGRSTSLHLFEHVHGESKDRGQAMVDLKTHYEQAGLNLVPEELPDFIPAFLEFCSVVEPSVAGEFLGDCLPILQAVGERLAKKDSPWAAVFPVVQIFAHPTQEDKLPAVRPEADLDTEWAEEPAFSHPVQGVC